MEVIYGSEKFVSGDGSLTRFGKNVSKNRPLTQTAVGLGNFDGLHIGHMALVHALIEEAKKCSLKSMVYTFLNHPNDIINKTLSTGLLMSTDTKIKLLAEAGLNSVCLEEFDKEFSKTTAEDFVKDVLVGRLNARLVAVGFNYRFGRDGAGDVEFLKKAAKVYGFNVLVIAPVMLDGDVVSSTQIKRRIINGEVERSAELLGRNYSLSGIVQRGEGIGKNIGFATANIKAEENAVLPKRGVYATEVIIDGKTFKSVTNIGRNPTLGISTGVVIETHVIDFDGDLYDRRIEIFFRFRIRDEKKFDGLGQLAIQIQSDIRESRDKLLRI